MESLALVGSDILAVLHPPVIHCFLLFGLDIVSTQCSVIELKTRKVVCGSSGPPPGGCYTGQVPSIQI